MHSVTILHFSDDAFFRRFRFASLYPRKFSINYSSGPFHWGMYNCYYTSPRLHSRVAYCRDTISAGDYRSIQFCMHRRAIHIRDNERGSATDGEAATLIFMLLIGR